MGLTPEQKDRIDLGVPKPGWVKRDGYSIFMSSGVTTDAKWRIKDGVSPKKQRTVGQRVENEVTIITNLEAEE